MTEKLFTDTLSLQVFTCAALMLAPQFIVAQVCILGSSTSRVAKTKALLLNLYNTGQNRDNRDSFTLIVPIDFKTSKSVVLVTSTSLSKIA